MKNPTPLTTSRRGYRIFVFWIGILATLAYRALIIISHYSHAWNDIVWYLGTIGFVWYFAHRFHIEEKRDHIISERDLIAKVNKSKDIPADDREAVAFILKSQTSSLSRWNYIAIFAASALALAYDLILRFFWK